MAGDSEVTEGLKAIRQELACLGERVAALEAAVGTKLPAPTPAAAQVDGLSEEVILVISAAIAAFLGKKPHIRQIRLLGTHAWAQQGRLIIQATRTLASRHMRSER